MKIAVAQTEPIKGNIEKNIESHIFWIQKAIAQKANLIFFPELSLTGYEPEIANHLASNQDDTRLDCFQKLCDNHNIIIGVGLPTKSNNNLNISTIIFQPNIDRITYSKQYLYHTEKGIFKPAINPLVINYGSETIAPAICFELSNKKHHEYAYQNNASVYIASVLNSVNGVDEDHRKLSDIAKNYGMVTFMANYIGESGGYKCAGKSSVWNKNGELIQQLDDKKEGIIIYDTEKNTALTINKQEAIV